VTARRRPKRALGSRGGSRYVGFVRPAKGGPAALVSVSGPPAAAVFLFALCAGQAQNQRRQRPETCGIRRALRWVTRARCGPERRV
jgi:hypothetical protein